MFLKTLFSLCVALHSHVHSHTPSSHFTLHTLHRYTAREKDKDSAVYAIMQYKRQNELERAEKKANAAASVRTLQETLAKLELKLKQSGPNSGHAQKISLVRQNEALLQKFLLEEEEDAELEEKENLDMSVLVADGRLVSLAVKAFLCMGDVAGAVDLVAKAEAADVSLDRSSLVEDFCSTDKGKSSLGGLRQALRIATAFRRPSSYDKTNKGNSGDGGNKSNGSNGSNKISTKDNNNDNNNGNEDKSAPALRGGAYATLFSGIAEYGVPGSSSSSSSSDTLSTKLLADPDVSAAALALEAGREGGGGDFMGLQQAEDISESLLQDYLYSIEGEAKTKGRLKSRQKVLLQYVKTAFRIGAQRAKVVTAGYLIDPQQSRSSRAQGGLKAAILAMDSLDLRWSGAACDLLIAECLREVRELRVIFRGLLLYTLTFVVTFHIELYIRKP